MRQEVGRIVEVKRQREDTAQEALRRARLALEDAARRVQKAKDELVAYAKWRPGAEAALWDGIEGRLVRVEAIDDLKAEIGLLRGKEHVLEEKVEAAERERRAAHQAQATAQAAYDAAQRGRQKFEELSDLLDAEWRQELDRREESELEELASSRRTADIEERFR